MSNVVQTWLRIIGSTRNAQRLLDKRAFLDGRHHRDCRALVLGRFCMSCRHEVDDVYIVEPRPCPAVVLYGVGEMCRLYADAASREAMDAWDEGFVTKADVLMWARHIIASAHPSTT